MPWNTSRKNMETPIQHSPKSEPALEALANLIDQLDIPVTTDETLATEDRDFPPALVDGKEPGISQ
jgi:hypothetical protein